MCCSFITDCYISSLYGRRCVCVGLRQRKNKIVTAFKLARISVVMCSSLASWEDRSSHLPVIQSVMKMSNRCVMHFKKIKLSTSYKIRLLISSSEDYVWRRHMPFKNMPVYKKWDNIREASNLLCTSRLQTQGKLNNIKF